jgi:hypothetical protein
MEKCLKLLRLKIPPPPPPATNITNTVAAELEGSTSLIPKQAFGHSPESVPSTSDSYRLCESHLDEQSTFINNRRIHDNLTISNEVTA